MSTLLDEVKLLVPINMQCEKENEHVKIIRDVIVYGTGIEPNSTLRLVGIVYQYYESANEIRYGYGFHNSYRSREYKRILTLKKAVSSLCKAMDKMADEKIQEYKQRQISQKEHDEKAIIINEHIKRLNDDGFMFELKQPWNEGILSMNNKISYIKIKGYLPYSEDKMNYCLMDYRLGTDIIYFDEDQMKEFVDMLIKWGYKQTTMYEK